MSDWKVGDKVFYFWHASDCSLVWSIEDFFIEEDEITGFDRNGTPRFSDGYEFYTRHSIYKSKNEAIDAMIKHLEGFRND